MIFRTSAVADCCCRASVNSRRALTSSRLRCAFPLSDLIFGDEILVLLGPLRSCWRPAHGLSTLCHLGCPHLGKLNS